MRRGVSLLGIVMLVAGFAAAVARADGGTTTTTTTTDTTTTSTTTTPTTTTTAPPPTYTPLAGSRLPNTCVDAGLAAVESRDGSVVVVQVPAAGLGASEYPASHPYLTVESATKSGSGCTDGHVKLTGLSLFGGMVTATTVKATNGKGKAAKIAVNGAPVSLATGQSVAVGGWGLLTLGVSSGRLSAPLALRLLYRHNGVPAGTTIYLAFAAEPQHQPLAGVTPPVSHPHHNHHTKRAKKHGFFQPLKWTPKLGIATSDYVFPVDGGASYVDTYGMGRNDIYDGWHHGDDLFAPLGTPVVAVADGKLALVGWNQLGGWRLWLTDKKGNSFYYAHLAGYSSWIIHHRHVKAGQVIGFLGRTGDAFTTPPHLHFEIHPHQRQLVAREYDGAVDPTTYLQSWRVENLPASKIPTAARLRAPAGTPSEEAAVVWHELLKARHLNANGEPAVARTPSLRRPFPAEWNTPAFIDARRTASARLAGDAPPRDPWPLIALGAALAVIAAAGSFTVLRRRRSA